MNRKKVITTMAAGIVMASLPPAVAAAQPDNATCTQWSFNGETELVMEKLGSDTVAFSAQGPSLGSLFPLPGQPVQPPTFAVDHLSGSGSAPGLIQGTVVGGIGGDHVDVTFQSPQLSGGLAFDGRVGADGVAHGTVGPFTWHSGGIPLKCTSKT